MPRENGEGVVFLEKPPSGQGSGETVDTSGALGMRY